MNRIYLPIDRVRSPNWLALSLILAPIVFVVFLIWCMAKAVQP